MKKAATKKSKAAKTEEAVKAATQAAEPIGFESEEEETPPSAPTADPNYTKAPWLARVNAERCLKTAIAALSKHDYTRFGINGISEVVDALHAALDNFPKKSANGKAKVEPGATVKVREKAREKYEDVLSADALIKVDSVRKALAVCLTDDGDKMFIPVKDLEVASNSVSH